MKAILIAAVALSALAAPAFAQDSVAVNGTVDDACGALDVSEVIELGELADSDGMLKAEFQTADSIGSITLEDVWCNSPGSTLTVDYGANNGNLVHTTWTGAAPDGFVTSLGTEPYAMFRGTEVSPRGDATLAVGVFAEDIEVGILGMGAPARLIAGTYAGTIEITLTPGS